MAQAIPMIFVAASTALSANSAIQQGKAATAAAKYESAQLEDAAGIRRQEGAAQAEEVRRQKNVAISDSRAAAAASGGGGIGEGQYQYQEGRLGGAYERNALSTIYQANVEALGLKNKAKGARYEGKVARQASLNKTLSTVISGGSKMYDMRA